MNNDKTVKLTEDELTKFKEISETYQQVIMKFGEFHLEKMELQKLAEKLESKESDLTKLYMDTQDAEKIHIDSILKKYGEGSLSLKDGTFTSI